MKIRTICYILLLLLPGFAFGSTEDSDPELILHSVSGYVKDATSGESLIGATVYITEQKTGAVTNRYGYYSISLKPGKYNIVYSFIGYDEKIKELDIKGDITLDIELEPKKEMLESFVVSGKNSSENITSSEMSVVKMDIKTIEKIPALMGEVDVLKAIQLLPGVQSAGEGATGFSVRGGSKDQNLILLDEANVYNASHLMGFFSVFNNDVIKDLKLYKGDIPAQYGGRLSSLLDIQQKEGNLKSYHGRGGIGTISSRLTIEGPLIKDKASFIVAGRRSYADLFLKLSPNENLRNNILYFYDFNGKINLRANKNNRIYISSYIGQDIIKIAPPGSDDPFKMAWGNKTFTLRWNHIFSSKLFSNFSVIHSTYNYDLGIDAEMQGFEWISDLSDHSFKADFGYYANTSNTIRFGAQVTYHDIFPGYARGKGEETIFNELRVPASRSMEYAAYVSNEQKLGDIFALQYGLRYSMFQNLGVGTSYNFDDNFEAIDSIVYPKGEIYNTYHGWEPRVGLKLMVDKKSSIKASYNRTLQYIHLASNSTVGSPLDVWMPSSPNIEPQVSDQIAIGYFRNFKDNMIETSIEFYYKKMQNQIDFKDHASLILNPLIEGEVRIAEATSMGMEVLIRKQVGKLTGWVSYTLSKTERQSEYINDGKKYRSPYDRPHDVSVVLSYEITPSWSVSGTWVYASGAPVTFPTGRFSYGGIITPVYSDRNSYRMPDYHRLDLAVTYEGKKSETKKWHSSWTVSVYNAYNRHNAFSIDFEPSETDPNVIEAEMTYLFPIIPAITYNFNF